MNLFPQDRDVVLYETAFENDFLERAKISKQLSGLVESIEDPIVLALDDKWGSGKTYFLKRWVAAHQKENDGCAITVYFDAFESDYLSDPLISIIAAVSERIPKGQDSTLEKWKIVATKLAKPTFGIALSLATFGAKKHVDDIGDALADAVSSEAKDAASGIWDKEKERKDAVKIFKELLVEFTKEGAAPIVIVIDELDRCRPDYALSVLEVIKHFFAVPKVHFILGVNGKALESSVRARYGVDVDAESYLRKFINASFSLPRAIGHRGSNKIITSYAAKLVKDMELPEKVATRCVDLISCVSANNDVSLRDVGKILSKIALLPSEVFEKSFLNGWIDITCVLVVSSVVDPMLHKKLLAATASVQEIRDFTGASVSKTTQRIGDDYNPDYDHSMAVWFVEILYCCGPSDILEADSLPHFFGAVAKQFDEFGSPSNPKGIAAKIQTDWVDIFRT